MEIYQQIFWIIAAIPFGLFSGLILGIPGSLVILLTLPVLLSMDPIFILAFYTVIAVTTQFTNSVMAIYTGIPGDTTAIPIVKERDSLNKNFSIKQNLIRTAVASTIGVLFGWLFLIILFESISPFTNYLLRSELILITLILILVIACFWKGNSHLVNIIFVCAGLTAGLVGYHYTLELNILTFNNIMLLNGLPFIAAFSGMYAAPNVLYLQKFYRECSIDVQDSQKKKQGITIFRMMSDSLIGSLVGILGLVPLIGSAMSSNVSYSISKKFTESSLRRCIFSESSNSSAFIIVMSPLLFFGIAIVPSELILLEALRSAGWVVSDITQTSMTVLLLVSLFAVGVSFYASTKLAEHFVKTLIKYIKFAVPLLFLILLANVYFIGSMTKETEIYLITFFVSLPIGLFCRKKNIDCLPLIFSWAIAETLLNVAFTTYNLYS